MGFGLSVDFQAEDEYINVSGNLPGFIAELTTITWVVAPFCS